MFVGAIALRALFEWADLPIGNDTRFQFPLPRWLEVIALMTVMPVVEEVIFRGLVITGLRKLSFGFWPAAAISTALFAAIHLPTPAYTAIYYAMIGLLLCLVLYKTKKLRWCIAAHAAYNAVPAMFTLIYLR